MKTIGLLVLIVSTGILAVSGEPVQYRQNQRARSFETARQVSDSAQESADDAPYPPAGQRPDKSLQLPSEVTNVEQPAELPTEHEAQTQESETEIQTTTELDAQTPAESEARSANGPYPPSGWRPEGPLLVLPLDAQASETTTSIAEETTLSPETVEPQGRSSSDGAPYAPSGWKPAGRLLLLPNEQQTLAESSPAAANQENENNENDDKEEITENTNTKTSTDKPLAKLETTSEPEAEAVDASVSRQGNPEPNIPPSAVQPAPGTYFVQLPNGALQRVVYVTSPLISPVAATSVQYQQLIQAQPVLATNPAAAPRIVAYTTQYQSW